MLTFSFTRMQGHCCHHFFSNASAAKTIVKYLGIIFWHSCWCFYFCLLFKINVPFQHIYRLCKNGEKPAARTLFLILMSNGILLHIHACMHACTHARTHTHSFLDKPVVLHWVGKFFTYIEFQPFLKLPVCIHIICMLPCNYPLQQACIHTG